MPKKELDIKINLEPIINKINVYLERKIKRNLNKFLTDEVIFDEMRVQFPVVKFPKIERRFEDIEDMLKDLEYDVKQLKENAKEKS